VLPSVFILWTLSWVYVVFGKVAWVSAVFHGLKPAVLAIVASAVIRIGRRVLRNEVLWLLAGLAFVCIHYFGVPFPAIIFGAAIIGLTFGKLWPAKFLVLKGPAPNGSRATVISDDAMAHEHTKPSLARGIKVCVVCLALWWTPIVLAGVFLGRNHVVFKQGLFFSKAAMVTFGGAYAVLPYVSQQAVERYHWLAAEQMLDGLGLAETTPGPLIMVLQFVGFLGGWNQPGSLPPLVAATLGALITTWTTFVPCFLWIFLGAPHIEQLRGNTRMATALSAVTAAVVGVILNLAVWFGWHVILPGPETIDWFAVAVSVVAFLGMLKWKWNILPVVIGSGLVGLLYRMLSHA
jgi:chromate transporter